MHEMKVLMHCSVCIHVASYSQYKDLLCCMHIFSGVMKLCMHTILNDKVSALLDSRDHHPLLYIYLVGLYTCSLQLLV